MENWSVTHSKGPMMKIKLDPDKTVTFELTWGEIANLLIGREINIPEHNITLINRRAYDAFNARARFPQAKSP
jgi:hypothetical protein